MALVREFAIRFSIGEFRGVHGQIRQIRCNSSSQNRWLKRQSNDYYTREAKIRDLRSRAAFKLMEIDDKFRLFAKNGSQRVLDLGFAPGAWSQVAKDRIGFNGVVLGVDILPCEPPSGVSSIQANILSKKTHELIRLFFFKHFELNHDDKLHPDKGYFQHMLEEELTHKEDFRTYKEVFTTDTFDDSVAAEQSHKLPIDVIISDMYEPWIQTSGFWNNLTNFPYYRMANTSGLAIRDHYQSIDLGDAALITAIDLLKPMGSFVCKLYTGKEDKLFENRLRKVFKKVSRIKPDACRTESKEIYFVGLGKRAKTNKIDVFS
ncbi:hypothetical protein HG535_0B01070 [Zygotorulaspora mrakii]|uniref:rRNA methyltransferase 2, mitochondrial n=1 Tax=Zygotorulaspora mrakii TaxID=42260 RepID=A0A7H9AZE5_ZYGMR|nr:uncharacterized protein HG535_0B01070 [Zygotorulaspora mrakii]QLG71069.1 hypothetical protein HG535_0B01070 [Zygotorulaspora mrakii]